jgi:hypothetical protein
MKLPEIEPGRPRRADGAISTTASLSTINNSPTDN